MDTPHDTNRSCHGVGGNSKVKNFHRQQSREAGSIAPLGIGLALVSLSAILVFMSVSSIFVLQRRLTTLAEFAALSGARYGLSAAAFIQESGANGMTGLRIAKDGVTDLLTHEVSICRVWNAPLLGLSNLLPTEICGHGAARAG